MQDRIVVRLDVPAGADGFWPRENYFAGGAANGYAVRVGAARPVTLERGRAVRLEVANHVPHLPYTYDGPPVTLGAAVPALLVFQWGGRVVPVDDREVETFVQHRFDPGGTTESVDAAGNPIVQRGRRGEPLLYGARVVGS
jgi:hypothetical protein